MNRRIARRSLEVAVLGALVSGLPAVAASPAAYAADDHRPPKILGITPDDGGLRVRWGPDTFFSGSVPGESVTVAFGAYAEGHWTDRGATTSHTISAARVKSYAGQAPRVTVCYLWPGDSKCAASDPIPIAPDSPPSYPPGTGQLRGVPAPYGLKVTYGDYRATVQWVNASSQYNKVLFRYDPGTQWDLSGKATRATTGTLVPGRTYVFKVKGSWSGGITGSRYSSWTELRWTAPAYPPYHPGGSQKKPYGPDTCKQGYVWREATPADRVCVTPATRNQTRLDNAQAAARRAGAGPYGPDTCRQGYVWRETTPADHVCVTPATRAQVRADNAQAAARRA
ncbi:hypothetical protein [Streptosporangium sp. NPDC002524]|uniref:hypothetical protein n=1 Tax=Streptosporangium sp. NPDC002524 TaxID=3154537 RepID=UPI00332251B2